jgi:hypothetical protein
MTEVTLTYIGGPTVLLEVEGWRLLTDPTLNAPGRRYTFGWGSASHKTSGPAVAAADLGPIDVVLLSHDHHGDNLDDAGRALLAVAGVVLTTTPGARRLGGNARGLQPWATIRLEAELRAGEALVFDWTSLAFCCAAAGEISLRPTTLRKAQRSPAYLPLRTGDGSSVFAHRRAYPMLVGRDIEVDCRRRLGVRSFSSSLPSTSGCTRRSDASPEATAGTARLPVPMLRPTDAQQEIRRTIGQLSANVRFCDKPYCLFASGP